MITWINSDDIGGLPRPYRHDGTRRDRSGQLIGRSIIKTMLTTLRFRSACFAGPDGPNLERVVAIRLRLNRGPEHPLAFDDLQIVQPR